MEEQASTRTPPPTAPQERRLARALQHVEKFWFPVNPTVYNDIRGGLNEGRYDFGFEFLLDDLKKDFSLYIHCLKELSCMLQTDGIKAEVREPLELLSLAGIERLKRVFSPAAESISTHSLHVMGNYQAKVIKGAMVSASSVSVLCTNKELNGEQAYLTALLRQLGLTLIAWNYQSVFTRAVDEQTVDKSLDSILSELLGFSPLLLAIRVMQNWNLSPDILSAVSPQDYAASNTSETLVKLCEIGEALARANEPELYPSAQADWATARIEIEHILGEDGLNNIAQHVKDYCSEYRRINPPLFQRTTDLNPERYIHQHLEQDLLSSNPFAAQCTPALKRRFRDFYAAHEATASTKESLTTLVKRVFPAAGFNAGCIYTYDPGTRALVARLRVGTVELRALAPVPVSEDRAPHDPVQMAFHCTTPVRGDDAAEQISYIVGCLGEGSAMGVLYVELATVQPEESDVNHLAHFKAVRHALHSVLKL